MIGIFYSLSARNKCLITSLNPHLIMNTKTINGVDYYMPSFNDEVLQLIVQAHQNNQKISVRGAAHSIPLVKTNEEYGKYLYIILAEMKEILYFDKQKGVVKVQAGCHLGMDPNDPTGISTIENSLVYQIDPFDVKNSKRIPHTNPGWALPDLGGISHQTIGGFIATGSSGGSVHSNFEDAIISVDIAHYDGSQAVIETFNRSEDEDNAFFGIAFANLGLMGIVVSVTFQCIPSYYIFGSEITTTTEECSIDLFGSGVVTTSTAPAKLSVEDFFKQKNLYSRFMWWPQKGIDKMTVWQATATPVVNIHNWQNFESKPYNDLPPFPFKGDYTPANMAVYYIYTLLDDWPVWLEKLFGVGPRTRKDIEAFAERIAPNILKFILKVFEPINQPQTFKDIWWNGLPMDNEASDTWFPVWFTELWISIDQTEAVMKDLNVFFESSKNAGNFSTEIYAAGSNLFWMSPAYKMDVIRIDIYWFANDEDGTPEEYYIPFWNELEKYNFRPHWAKFLPAPDSNQGVAYLSKRYPKWQQWRDLRVKMDPNNIFLTEYWDKKLKITG